MLKYVKHHMESIAGIEIYPLISFLIFFLFFLGMLLYLLKSDPKHMRTLSALPLDNPPAKTSPHEKK